ncbi:MAG: hypothetical protein LUG85_02895 [Clostridiales bacterium]|nr:hypothetical protein [Clostridiales bacterium]MCD7827468.1 hypothetical protein [Clostridiales bacterium]
MNKKNILWIALDLVFIVAFNIIFFAVGGTHHTAAVWTSYGFIHFSYLMVVVTPFLTSKKKSSAILGFPLSTISAAYFLAELLIGLLFTFIEDVPNKAVVIVQVILTAIYLIFMLLNLIANEHTADSLATQKMEADYIKSSAVRVKLLIGETGDKEAERMIERVYDMLRSSPTKSSQEVQPIEFEIKEKIFELEDSVADNSKERILTVSKEILRLLRERNAKLSF